MVSDDIAHLGFALHHQRGAYALLIGSGVSRAANVMTGEEVLKDFIKTHAEAVDEAIGDDPKVWYQTRFNEAPSYSNVLRRFATHEDVRSRALDKYFTAKTPSNAHRAIADLVRDGYIKIIITTNFDRLIEQALDGQKYRVYTFDDLERGVDVAPLQHAGVVVFKLHGDYIEGRLLNTPEELSNYNGQAQALLSRIVDEYGLIACGWSADWDVALRETILANTRRRYPLYYCHYAPGGEPSPYSKQLINQRDGIRIDIENADEFFNDLLKVVRTYSRTSARPFNREIARTETLRLLGTERGHVELERIWQHEFNSVLHKLNSSEFIHQFRRVDDDVDIQNWVIANAEVMENLLEMVVTLCWYGKGKGHDLIRDTITSLAEYRPHQIDRSYWILPVHIVLWIVGTVAVDRDIWDYLEAALSKAKVPRRNIDKRLIRSFPLFLNAGENQRLFIDEPEALYAARLNLLTKHVLPLIGSVDRMRYSRDIYEFVLAAVIWTDAHLLDVVNEVSFVPVEHTSDRFSWARIGHFVLDYWYDSQKREPVGVVNLWRFRRHRSEVIEAIRSLCDSYRRLGGPFGQRDYPLYWETFDTSRFVSGLMDHE